MNYTMSEEEILKAEQEFIAEVNCTHENKVRALRRYVQCGFNHDENGRPYPIVTKLDALCCFECHERMRKED